MAKKLEEKIKHGLDESRILILGAQVLLGFQFQSTFEQGFDRLPVPHQYLQLGALLLLIVAVGLLMSPAPYHYIAASGESNLNFHGYITGVASIALLPFALTLGIDLYVAVSNVVGMAAGVAAGVLVLAVALFFWYGLELITRGPHDPHKHEDEQMEEDNKDKNGSERTSLKDRVDHVLTESRVVLPGAQALLGFQFIIILGQGFERLPDIAKYVHLASLCLIALAVIFLMAPAAYHRIVEDGDDTERFHRFASRMILSAMVPMGLGICGDLFVVMLKVTGSMTLSIGLAGAALLFLFGLWFGYSFYQREKRGEQKHPRPGLETP